MLINQNIQTKYLLLNTNDKTDTTRWNIPTNNNFSQKIKMALVSINNATDNNLNMVFCPTIKDNHFSSLNTHPLIYSGIGYNNQNIINGKQYYDVNGAYFNEIELKTFSSPPQNDFSYPELDGLKPVLWYKFDDSTNLGLDTMGKLNLGTYGANSLPTYDTNSTKGSGSAKFIATQTFRSSYNWSDFLDEITICFWLKISGLTGSGDTIMSNTGDGNKLLIQRNALTSNFSLRLFNSGSLSTHFAGQYIADNTWKHYTITIKFLSGVVEVKSYLNGVFNATTTTGTWSSTNLTSLALGNGTASLLGNLDDIRFYNKVLNQDQINTIYGSRNNYPIIKNESYKLPTPNDNDLNIHLIPNLWFKFDTGALLTNSGTNVITLTNFNASPNAGISIRGNNSISFNGTTQYLTGTGAILTNNGSFSISVWIYPKALSAVAYNIVCQFYKTGQTFWVNFPNTYKYEFGIAGMNAVLTTSTFAGDLNTWVNLVFTYNSTNRQVLIYRNGVLLPTSNNILSGALFGYENVNFSIGATNSPVNYFNGNIDDLRTYSFILTQDQITRIYNGDKIDNTILTIEPVIGQDLTPNLWFKFDTGALLTNDGTDITALGNNGTTLNAGVSVRGNDSVSFNGTSQFLNNAVNPPFLGISGNSWSASAWVYSKSSNTNGGIINFGNSSTAFQTVYAGFNSTKYYITDNNTTALSDNFAGDINNWVHIVFIFNSQTLERSIYRNGVKLNLTNPTAGGQSAVSTRYSIGAVSYIGNFYTGNIDDLRVYTGKVLSQAQINEIYAGNTFYNLPTALTRYNTNPTNTQYQFEVVDEEQKLINRY